MDCLSSMYIDNELNLDEKIQFVDKIYSQAVFYEDTRALLLQEKVLRLPTPPTRLANRPPLPSIAGQWIQSFFKPLIYAAAGFAATGLLLFSLMTTRDTPMASVNRFIIYEPAAHKVELTGSFTDWQRTPLQPVGSSGYWELILPIPAGEHRFAYILDDNRQMADPTLPGREKDDYGGENSILKVEAKV
jgi:hypothetical protein